MRLLTKELLKRFEALGEQDVPNPIVVARFFHPFSSWEWYVTAYDPTDEMFFGWVNGSYPELGYFGLKELEDVRVMGLPIERDLYWQEKRLDEVKAYVSSGTSF